MRKTIKSIFFFIVSALLIYILSAYYVGSFNINYFSKEIKIFQIIIFVTVQLFINIGIYSNENN